MQFFSWVSGRTYGEESANQLYAGLRGELLLADGLVLLAGFNYDYNLHAGVKRRFEEQAGVGVQPLAGERHRLRFDLGVSLVQEWASREARPAVLLTGRVVGEYR